MESLFTWCAVLGGTVFAVQFLLLLIGFDDGGDLDVPDMDVPDMDSFDEAVSVRDLEVDFDPQSLADADGWFVGIITFRSLVSAIAVFGFTGSGAIQQFPPAKAMTIALLAGGTTLYLIGWMFKKIYQLNYDGTVKMSDAVGASGSVYLPIPANNSGVGKVTVFVSGRTMEYPAMTAGEELKAGTPIFVSKLLSKKTVEVQAQADVKSASQETANVTV